MYLFIGSSWQIEGGVFPNSGKILAGYSGCFLPCCTVGCDLCRRFVVIISVKVCCNCWVVGIKLVVLYRSERRASVVCDWSAVGADFLLELVWMCWPFLWTLPVRPVEPFNAVRMLSFFCVRCPSLSSMLSYIFYSDRYRTEVTDWHQFCFYRSAQLKKRGRERQCVCERGLLKGCFIVHKFLGTLWKIASASLKEKKKRSDSPLLLMSLLCQKSDTSLFNSRIQE